MDDRVDLVPGTLDMMLMKAVSGGGKQEIGMRVALGAQPAGVVRLMVSRALALIGILGGVATSLVIARVVGALLYDLSATDPISYLAVPLLLILVAATSAWVPARRVLSADPRGTLVSE